jgi:hypothetical protein
MDARYLPLGRLITTTAPTSEGSWIGNWWGLSVASFPRIPPGMADPHPQDIHEAKTRCW